MKQKTIQADYWDKKIEISVPEDTLIGEIPPPAIIQDPEKAVRDAIAHPTGSPPLSELAKKARNGKVTIGFDDPSRPGKPRQLIIPIILEELIKAGVKEENIYLLCGSGNHCKWTAPQLSAYLSPAIYDRFCPNGSASRVLNHDCHDPENLVYMGTSELGDYVEYNKFLLDSDLFIYTGTVVVSNWGGMTGTGVIIGYPSTRSMTSTHGFPVVGHPDSCHGNQHTMMYRAHKQAIMAQIEKFTGKRVFYVDVVPSTGGAPAGVFAGYSPEINEPTWKFAESIYNMEVPQADVLIYGVPRYSLYGETSNPLIALAAACAPVRMWTNKPLLREGGVVIALVHCDGTIDERTHPSYAEILDLYRNCFSMEELSIYEEEFRNREDLIFKYKHAYAYAPVHGFWLMYESEYALNQSNKVIFAGVPGMDNPLAKVQVSGTGGPGSARDVGCTPAKDFAEAMKIAEKVVGKNPKIMACPSFWTKIRPRFYVK
ncbi:MAG: lactate racemase domain-containing protein [Dehalococcoidia bacterium]